MSLIRLSVLLLCIAGLQIPHITLAATCSLSKVADLSVTVDSRNRVFIDGSIKGEAVKFQVDTGAALTTFDSSVFSHFGIPTAGTQTRIIGAGGESYAISTKIPGLKFGNFIGDNLTWQIATTHFLPNGVYGLLGQDFLGSFDLDIDLANNKIGLFAHNSCASAPVYWSSTFSEAELSIKPNAVFAIVTLNGIQFDAHFDTGAGRSYISTAITRRMGLDQTSQGMEKAGFTRGIDLHRMEVYRYRFAELSVGDEVIKNPILNVVNLSPVAKDNREGHGIQDDNAEGSDGLLGADFIKTHHIYLAPKDRKMYFTYNGGGIFSPPKEDPATAATK